MIIQDLQKGGHSDIQTANKAPNTMIGTCDGFILAEPLNTNKRIGSTVYEVEVYVKAHTGETAEAKIIRLIKNDLNLAPGHGKMLLPQTGRLPERGSA
jgi:hypothetical protein